MKVTGKATPEGTKRYAERFKSHVNRDFYVTVEGLTLSTLGLGTYLGEADERDDSKLKQALTRALESGINVIDSSINYRSQRSERVIGQVLAELVAAGKIKRDEVFVATKGGFIPFDGGDPEDPQAYFRDRFLKTKILGPGDVAAGCHSLAPQFIKDQFDTSRTNLNLETIDLYYLHNPETQLEEFPAEEVYKRLHRAFVVLESEIKSGRLQFYGTATWSAFRAKENSEEFLYLDEIKDAASDHGSSHGFKFIQLPLNLAMPEALTVKNQKGSNILELSKRSGIHVMCSASIMQGKILGQLPERLDVLAPNQPDAVKALNFVRSAPGVSVALCGMKELSHLNENLGLRQTARLSETDLIRAIKN
jgi:aryl-alcohol dehydrogenase-like predicted oxidoreductase